MDLILGMVIGAVVVYMVPKAFTLVGVIIDSIKAKIGK